MADPSEEFQFLRVGPDSNVPPRYRAPVSSLCQIGNLQLHHHLLGTATLLVLRRMNLGHFLFLNEIFYEPFI